MRKRDYSKYAEMYQAGMSLPEISANCGINTGSLYRGIKALGVPMRNMTESWANSRSRGKKRRQARFLPSMQTFDYKEARRLYEEGSPLNELAHIFSRDSETIREALKRMGVQMRPRGGGKGENNHQFLGGTALMNTGYMRVRGTRAKRLEHRVIAEKVLGRPLKRSEIVHHINGDKTDNANNNLLICTNSYHMQLHARMRRHSAWNRCPYHG